MSAPEAPGGAGSGDPGPVLEVAASVVVAADVDRVFAGLTAFDRQGEWIPFTTVRVVAGDGREGSRIEAVTSVGPLVIRDLMRVTRFDPPYEVGVVHEGRLLRGPGVFRCAPVGKDRTHVVWHEWFHLPGGPVGRAVAPLLWPGSRAGFTYALRRFARLVEQGRLP
ncbi:MAG TPA: SRPBCC family protein [Natronosporangium sp.]|nr:SRPBCC family protein [Natronosporangium sp.]